MASLFISNSEAMKKDVYKFLISCAITVTLFIIVDAAFGLVGDYLVSKMPNFSGQIAKDNYRKNRVSTDVVIVGSSRAAHHYVTTELRDSINHYTNGQYSLYNGGIDGRFINSTACSAESILERYSPKLLVFEVSEWELSGSMAQSDMEFAAINYKNNLAVKRYLDGLGWQERVKMSFNMYRYNQKVFRILSSFFKSGDETGYEPLYAIMPVSQQQDGVEKKNVIRTFDEYTLNHFLTVLQTAKEKEVRLVVVSSPFYKPADCNQQLKELCEKYDTPYIELYDVDYFNQHPELFKDKDHLNDKGAHLYTELFFQELKPYLKDMIKI